MSEPQEQIKPRVTLTGSSAKGWIVSYGTEGFAFYGERHHAEAGTRRFCARKKQSSYWHLNSNWQFVEVKL